MVGERATDKGQGVREERAMGKRQEAKGEKEARRLSPRAGQAAQAPFGASGKRILTALLLCSCALAAGEESQQKCRPPEAAPLAEPREVGITAYSPAPGSGERSYSIIKERRTITLEAGRNILRLSEMPHTLNASSVRLSSLTDPEGFRVLEQTFSYDLATSEALLRRFLKKTVSVRHQGEVIEGTLLAFDDAHLTVKTPSGPETLPRAEARITLLSLPEDLQLTPTLEWIVEAEKAGTHEVELSYQVEGLGWVADYSLVLAEDGKSGDLSAWVTLDNKTGGSFPQARLKLIAGAVNFLAPMTITAGFAKIKGDYDERQVRREAAQGFTQKSFFEYHLYTLSRPVDLPARSVKQIELFPPRVGKAKRQLIVDSSQGFYTNGGAAQGASIEVTLKNDEASGLGIPLPKGRVRIYQRDDADDSLELIGEDRIDHTPKDEEITLRLGRAFDVVAEQKQVSFKDIGRGYDYEYEWKIRNRSQKAEEVSLRVHHGGASLIPQGEAFTSVNAALSESLVTLAPGEEKVIRYTLRYRW